MTKTPNPNHGFTDTPATGTPVDKSGAATTGKDNKVAGGAPAGTTVSKSSKTGLGGGTK